MYAEGVCAGGLLFTSDGTTAAQPTAATAGQCASVGKRAACPLAPAYDPYPRRRERAAGWRVPQPLPAAAAPRHDAAG